MMNRLLYFFSACVFCFSAAAAAELPEKIVIRPAAVYPHDSRAYTQGLLWDGGVFYESTGQYGESSLRRVEPKTGLVTAHVQIPKKFFSEGLALVGDTLFMVTWQEHVCFLFDKTTLKKKGEFTYSGEGWGLTANGEHLILSDGTHVLRFLDPKTFKQKRKIEVMDKNAKTNRSEPVRKLNELEWIHGEVWANVYQTNYIARINPKSGKVIGWLDMSSLVPEEHRRDTLNCVLNGIAFDASSDQIYFTGKNWNVIHCFQLEVPQ